IRAAGRGHPLRRRPPLRGSPASANLAEPLAPARLRSPAPPTETRPRRAPEEILARMDRQVTQGGACFSLDSVGINRREVVNERVIQERSSDHPDPEPCEGGP